MIDFTWEREWRIKCEELTFSSADVTIVLPSKEWASALLQRHDDEQDLMVELYANAMEREDAELWREPFRWHMEVLN